MKILFLSFALTAGLSYSAIAQSPSWEWAKKGGGGAADYAYGTAVDASGNVYYCGNFYSTSATFGSVTLTSTGLADGFLCKYDANGNFKWVRQISGPDIDACVKVVAYSNGDVYVTGYSEGDFSADGISFTSYGEDDGFIAKYSSSGVLKWINHMGGSGEDYPYSIALDNSGRCVVVGTFEHSMDIGGVTLTSQNDSLYDCFVGKFNKQGDLMWATSAGGSESHAYAFPSDVIVDANGTVFITGTYTGPLNFGNNTLYSTEEAFLAKLSSSGVFQWAADAGSRCYYTYIALDGSSNLYVTGSFGAYGYHSKIGDFTLIPNGSYMDVYLAKFNSSGVAQSVQTGGSGKNDYAGGLAVDALGNAWVTGYIQGNVATFGSESFTSSGKEDVFVTSYDASGNVNWLMKAAGPSADRAFDLAYDGNTTVYIAGSFKNSITMGSITLTSGSSSADAFLARIDINGFMKTENETVSSISLLTYPNPATNELAIESLTEGNYDLQILSLDGKIEMNQTFELSGTDEKTIDVSALTPGIYILQITSAENNLVTKFLKQ